MAKQSSKRNSVKPDSKKNCKTKKNCKSKCGSSKKAKDINVVVPIPAPIPIAVPVTIPTNINIIDKLKSIKDKVFSTFGFGPPEIPND